MQDTMEDAAASSSDSATSSSWSTIASTVVSSTTHSPLHISTADQPSTRWNQSTSSSHHHTSRTAVRDSNQYKSTMNTLEIDQGRGRPSQFVSQSDRVDPELIISSTPSSGAMSWADRLPWINKHKRRKRRRRRGELAGSSSSPSAVLAQHLSHQQQVQIPDSLDYQNGEAIYYRCDNSNQPTLGKPRLSDSSPVTPTFRPGGVGVHVDHHIPPSTWQRVSSWITSRSLSHEQEEHQLGDDGGGDADLDEFTDDDWTPPDSSYGAAIPVGGWIPKNIRRLIEWTILGSLFLSVVYFLITTSIRLRDSGASNSAVSYEPNTYDNMNNYYYKLNETSGTNSSQYQYDDDTSSNYNTYHDDIYNNRYH